MLNQPTQEVAVFMFATFIRDKCFNRPIPGNWTLESHRLFPTQQHDYIIDYEWLNYLLETIKNQTPYYNSLLSDLQTLLKKMNGLFTPSAPYAQESYHIYFHRSKQLLQNIITFRLQSMPPYKHPQ